MSSKEKEVDPAEADEMLDEKPKSLIMGIISQLKVGMDLSKVTLPTFILEPRSFLEKLTDFMLHEHLVLGYVPRFPLALLRCVVPGSDVRVWTSARG